MEEIAQVYARSLFEVAKENEELDEIHEQLGEFTDALDGNRELQVFFFSPYFSSQEKTDGVDKVIDDGNEHLVNFLKLIAERHRMPALFRMRRAFDALWREEMLADARRDIEQETRRAIGQIRREVADLTVIATEKVARKTLDDDDHRRLIDEALQEFDFSQLPGGGSPTGNGGDGSAS